MKINKRKSLIGEHSLIAIWIVSGLFVCVCSHWLVVSECVWGGLFVCSFHDSLTRLNCSFENPCEFEWVGKLEALRRHDVLCMGIQTQCSTLARRQCVHLKSGNFCLYLVRAQAFPIDAHVRTYTVTMVFIDWITMRSKNMFSLVRNVRLVVTQPHGHIS